MNTTATAHAEPAKDRLFTVARSILFRFDPERAHDLALGFASTAPVTTWLGKRYHTAALNLQCMGQEFRNPVGLAAGLDKNGDYIDALGAMGFGFIEIGTVTPKPQPGNPKPRMFRLTEHNALINRLGFNNLGVDHLVTRAEKRRYTGVLGINIGKNASTSLDDANSDYLQCLEKVYAVADYITVNVSSPNTKGLRDLQHGKRLHDLLDSLKNAQSSLATQHGRYKPILVKVAPDMSDAELTEFCSAVLEHEIDGVIAGNTTNQRDMVADSPLSQEHGGLSGTPMRTLANDRLAVVTEQISSKATVIGVGGISCGKDAQDKRDLGANLVQLYTGFIYQGPALVRDCVEAMA